MRLQVDNEFQQVKIKDLNEMNDAEMFTTSVSGGKAFAAEQKIRELETRISTLNAQKLKILPTKIILNSAINMKNVPSERYGLTPEESISIERFGTIFNMHRIKRAKLVHHKKNRYDKKKWQKKEKHERKFEQ